MARVIEKELYRLNVYGICGAVYVEADNKEDLYKHVAERVLKGQIIQSVNRIQYDGKTPKVAVFTDKKYKEIYKELSEKK